MAEHDKRGTKQGNKQQKPSAVMDLPDFVQGAESAFLTQLKAVRGELDAGIPKILLLSIDQRDKLYGHALVASVILSHRSAFRASLAPSFTFDSSATDKRVQVLRELSLALKIDPARVPADKKKQYEAGVVQTWGEARAALNEVLETPSARKLLESTPKKPQ